jgi:hypothetical protein
MGNNPTSKNLDKECFSCSIEIVKGTLKGIKDQKEKKKKAKNLFILLNKSLGVLQEDGVFAFYVYLKSEKDEDKKNEKIEEQTIKLLNGTIDQQLDTLEKIKSLATDINTLLLAKSLIEKTLIYARYQAKSFCD